MLCTDIPSGRTFNRLEMIFDSSDCKLKEQISRKIKNNNFIKSNL